MPRPGDTFDRYVLEELLGHGGAGEVFRAHDTRLLRKVALKVLRKAPARGAARLLREARAAAAIEHACVVSIYDVGEADGTPFIAMELVGGRTLRSFVGDAAVPVERRIRWLADVARALAAAHARGLVHRDVKPENVMVRPDASIKVLDFGIARQLAAQDEAEAPPSSIKDMVSTLTAEGVLAGTPRYMAPEQLWGQPVDGRADQFAWGVVAYELLSGASPWGEVESATDLVTKVLSHEPPPLGPEVPSAVAGAVTRALSKAADDRFPTLDDLLAAIDGAAPVLASAPPPAFVSAPPPAMSANSAPSGTPGTGEVPGARSEGPPADAPTVDLSTRELDAIAPNRTGLRRAVFAAAIALVVAALLGGVLALSRSLLRPAGVARDAAPDAPPAATAITDRPVPRTSPEAEAAYRAGIQALRDASIMTAVHNLDAAVTADPRLAPAHMRLAIWKSGISLDDARAHFHRATALRGGLDARDQAMLHAIEPKVVVRPQDLAEGERRAAAAAASFPGDAEIAALLALYRQEQGHFEDTVRATARALELDPRFALALWMRANAEEFAGDADAARRSFGRCVEIAPGAASCLRARARLLEDAGACEEVEQDARRMIAFDPAGYRGYEFLAGVLIARGQIEAGREALRQEWALLDPARRRRRELQDGGQLALLVGDFAEAAARAEELGREATGSEEDRSVPARQLIEIHTETGDLARAAAIAEAFLARREAWVRAYMRPEDDIAPAAFAALRRAGKISRAELVTRRDAWLAAVPHGPAMKHGHEWVIAYARPSDTREDAEEALAALPRFLPIPREGHAALGHLRLLAGHPEEAVPLLEEGARHCGALRRPIEITLAHAWLGEAREARGDRGGACAAYAVVEARWGRGSGALRSRTAERVKVRSERLGCVRP